MLSFRALRALALGALLPALGACGSSQASEPTDQKESPSSTARESVTCGHNVPTAPRDAGQEGLEHYLQGIEVPVDPETLAPLCSWPARPIVFFAAHPDDETIGMAGAIRQAVAEGRPVFVELMTHGEASFARGVLNDQLTDSWHPGKHVYDLSVEDFGDARVREFLDAVHRLGVTGIHVAGFVNGELSSAQVAERVTYWTSRKEPGLSLRGTAGAQDPESFANPLPHPDHAAVWEALVASGHPDVLGYCIYQAVTGKCRFQQRVSLGALCPFKLDALAAYEHWDPESGRYAIAYHSTHGLLDDVAKGCREWIVRPAKRDTVPIEPPDLVEESVED
jgi:LmbE family N-acetylglucosaminyl deacetylase